MLDRAGTVADTIGSAARVAGSTGHSFVNTGTDFHPSRRMHQLAAKTADTEFHPNNS
jgi:hypothetical protein